MARIDLIKEFGKEDAETFNKISKGYSMGRKDERVETIEEFAETLKNPLTLDAFVRAKDIVTVCAIIKRQAEQMKGGAE